MDAFSESESRSKDDFQAFLEDSDSDAAIARATKKKGPPKGRSSQDVLRNSDARSAARARSTSYGRGDMAGSYGSGGYGMGSGTYGGMSFGSMGMSGDPYGMDLSAMPDPRMSISKSGSKPSKEVRASMQKSNEKSNKGRASSRDGDPRASTDRSPVSRERDESRASKYQQPRGSSRDERAVSRSGSASRSVVQARKPEPEQTDESQLSNTAGAEEESSAAQEPDAGPSVFAAFLDNMKKEQEEAQRLAEEQERQRVEEQRKREEEAAAQRLAEEQEKQRAEEERKREEEAAAQRRREEEEAKRRAEEEEEERKRQQEQERLQREAEREAEEKRRQDEEKERQRKEAEADAERRRAAEEAERHRKQREEEDRKRQEEERQRRDEQEKTQQQTEEARALARQVEAANQQQRETDCGPQRAEEKEAEAAGEEQRPHLSEAELEERRRQEKQAQLRQLYEEQQQKKRQQEEHEQRLRDKQEAEELAKRQAEEELIRQEQEAAEQHRRAEAEAERQRVQKQEELRRIHEQSHMNQEQDGRSQPSLPERLGPSVLPGPHETTGSQSAGFVATRSEPHASPMAGGDAHGPSGDSTPLVRWKRSDTSDQVRIFDDTPVASNIAVPSFGMAGEGMESSMPLMASVVRPSPRGHESRVPQDAPTNDRWQIPCDDGRLLLLRSTESAELEERRAYERALAQGFLRQSDGGHVRGSFEFTGQSSVPLGSTLRSSRQTDTLRPEELRQALGAGRASVNVGAELFQSQGVQSQFDASQPTFASRFDLSQRVDKAKLETLTTELQSLRKKIALLEEFNTELADVKAQSEEQTARLEERVLKLQVEVRVAKDATESVRSALREQNIQRQELQQELLQRDGALAALRKDLLQSQATREKELAEAHRREEELRGKNASLEEEINGCRNDLANVQVPPALLRLSRGSATASVSASQQQPNEELQRLRKELEQTEGMLRGFEKENESLVQQNRQLRQAARLCKEDVEERQLQLVAELNAAKASADTNPASMRRVSEAERELASAKERAEELARELDRCREAKRQLERELLHGPSGAAEAEAAAQGAQAALVEAKRDKVKMETELAELQRKLQWYVESQRDMDEDRRQVERLTEDLRTVRAENAELRRKPSSQEANRRAEELRKQVLELQDNLRKRHPDSILSLMKACEPRPEDRKEIRDLKQRNSELEAKLADAEQMHDRKLRSLRANYDHLRAEYEKRKTETVTNPVNSLELTRAGPSREAVLEARIRDLERQVEQVKSYYLTKLRKREPLVPSTKTRTGGRGPASAAPQHRQAELQIEIRERDARIDELSRALESKKLDAEFEPRQAETQLALSSSGSALLRLFLGSPEALPLASVSAELRSMAHAARRERFGDVSAQARFLASALAAEEHAAVSSDSLAASDVLSNREDPLHLQVQPALPSSLWTALRTLCEQLVATAANAELHHDAGAAVALALARLRSCMDAALRALLLTPSSSSSAPAWGPERARSVAPSLLPRLLVERVREELDLAPDQVHALLQDLQVHCGAQASIAWRDLVAALARSGLDCPRVLGDCHEAAQPDVRVPMDGLYRLLSPERGTPGRSVYGGVLRAVQRIKGVAAEHEPPLPVLLQRLDPEGRGFVARALFVQTMQGIRCSLSNQECSQLADFFAPAGEPHCVCYPLLLQAVVPSPGDNHFRSRPSSLAAPVGGQHVQAWPAPDHARLAELVKADGSQRARIAELQQENDDLRAHTRKLASEVAECNALFSQAPSQAVRRLQGEVALLERKVLEQQTAGEVAARKAEITLRGDLEVSRHEVSVLRLQLDTKDREIDRYQRELEAIIKELEKLRPPAG